jgi:AbrB family looped-hinge helix DNA binding protein
MNTPTPAPGTINNDGREYIGSVTDKGMITIPQELRRIHKIKPGGKVIFRARQDTIEVKPMPMTLEDAYGSVTPINRPENFKQIRNMVREERVEKAITKMNS